MGRQQTSPAFAPGLGPRARANPTRAAGANSSPSPGASPTRIGYAREGPGPGPEAASAELQKLKESNEPAIRLMKAALKDKEADAAEAAPKAEL